MSSIELGAAPFTISVSDERLSTLRQKLSNADLPDELIEAEWDYGVPLADMKRLITRWKDHFDWRLQEKQLNELPQFHAPIAIDGFETLKIHFVHKVSDRQGAIPLLFVHGWPGSFIEISKILTPLASPSSNHVSFHVVAPSLPNFGFSQGSRKRGFGLRQYAEVCHKLMLGLGYPEYVTQGGDWGYMITRAMGYLYPAHCKASHVNMLPLGPPSLLKNPLLFLRTMLAPMSSSDKERISRLQHYATEGNGYLVQQSTRPQTIGYALADSPTALLAWLYEKLHAWTDAYPWTDDEILTWVSLYYFSVAGPAASVRIYYELTHDDTQLGTHVRDSWIPHVKYGIAYLPKEIISVPRLWTQVLGNVVHEGEGHKGGHFAAWEQPDFLVDELRRMFGNGGGAYGVIGGKNGF